MAFTSAAATGAEPRRLMRGAAARRRALPARLPRLRRSACFIGAGGRRGPTARAGSEPRWRRRAPEGARGDAGGGARCAGRVGARARAGRDYVAIHATTVSSGSPNAGAVAIWCVGRVSGPLRWRAQGRFELVVSVGVEGGHRDVAGAGLGSGHVCEERLRMIRRGVCAAGDVAPAGIPVRGGRLRVEHCRQRRSLGRAARPKQARCGRRRHRSRPSSPTPRERAIWERSPVTHVPGRGRTSRRR